MTDNYYTSETLAKRLNKRGIGFVGTYNSSSCTFQGFSRPEASRRCRHRVIFTRGDDSRGAVLVQALIGLLGLCAAGCVLCLALSCRVMAVMQCSVVLWVLCRAGRSLVRALVSRACALGRGAACLPRAGRVRRGAAAGSRTSMDGDSGERF